MAMAVKSVKPVKNPVARRVAARKPAHKVSRRSSAETAKLQKTILKGLKGGKSVASLAEELGISRPYVYMLKNKG
jgi:DNA-binding CsgD family transcriptional regulator